MNEIKEKIRNYLLRSLVEDCLEDDDNLQELGLIHSLFIIQLVLFIEKEYKVDLSNDLSLDIPLSINNIAILIFEAIRKR